MTREWFAPRLLAATAATAITLAAVWPLVGYGWQASAGLLFGACVLARISRWMCETVRDRHWQEHRRRRAPLRHVWITPHDAVPAQDEDYCECGAHVKGTPCYMPLDPPRVGSTPETSIHARILATPSSVLFPYDREEDR